MKQKFYLNHAVQEGVLFLLISGWLINYSLDAYNKSFNKDWTQSPSLFPMLISGLLAVLAVTILVQGVKQENVKAAATGKKPLQVILLVAMSLLYYFILSTVKMPYLAVSFSSFTLRLSVFEISTLIFLLVMMLYLGVRSKPVLIAVPLVATVFLSIMFRTLLHVLLP